MKRILGIALFLLLASQVFGASYFVTATGQGTKSGTSLGNAFDPTAHNAATFTGDDIIHINAANGDFSSQLVVPSSGTSGHPITYIFDTAAKFSKSFWGSQTAAAIAGTNKSYITVDGNNTGIIENTDNGDGKTNHQLTDGIYISGGQNWIVQNLVIRTMFIHVANTANNPSNVGYNANCIQYVDSPNGQVIGCTLTDAYTGVLYKMTVTGTQNAPIIRNNSFATCSSAAAVFGVGPGCAMDNMAFVGNDVTMGGNWVDPSDANHVDGIHTSNSAGATYGTQANHVVHDNYFHGDGSLNSTGPIYLTDTVTGAQVYNNIVIGNTNHPAEGYIAFNLVGTCDVLVANNTVIGLGTSNTGGDGINFSSNHPAGTTTVQIKNNVIVSCFVGVYNPTLTVSWNSNNNCYFSMGAVGYASGSFQNTLANWQAITSGDNLSTVNDPHVNAVGLPTPTSSAIGTGANLAGLFTTGLNSAATFPNPTLTSRATTWDMGAYTVTTSGVAPTYSSGAINGAGSTLSVTYNASCTTGAGGNGGVTITASGGAVTPTYSSGSGSTTYVYTLSRTINIGETITTSYTQPGNGIEATSDGTDVASYSNQGVTNNSTQGSATSSSSVSGKVILSGKVQIK